MFTALLALLLAAAGPEFTLRWVVAEGYYLDESPSVITVETPKGILLDPASFATKGKVMGELTQTARIRVARGVADGKHALKATADLSYCSILERQCWPAKRTFVWTLETAKGRAKPLEVEIHIPE